MASTTTRRLSACVATTAKHHVPNYARCFFTTPARRQDQDQHKTASERNDEHLDRLALLQAEDQRLLKPVRAAIDQYLSTLAQGRALLTTLQEPAVRASVEIRALLAEAHASIARLENAHLQTLQTHVDDLSAEAYPLPESDEAEIDFLQRFREMSEEEQGDALVSINMETRAAGLQVRESVKRLETGSGFEAGSDGGGGGSDAEIFPARVERKGNPFAGRGAAKAAGGGGADAGKKRTDAKLSFGLSTDEQFANVVSDATARDEAVIRKKKVADSANFGLGLGQNAGEVRTWKPAVASATPKAQESRATSPLSRPVEARTKPPLAASARPAAGAGAGAGEAKQSPKPQSLDLNSLQAKLEASWKKAGTR